MLVAGVSGVPCRGRAIAELRCGCKDDEFFAIGLRSLPRRGRENLHPRLPTATANGKQQVRRLVGSHSLPEIIDLN